MKARHNTISYSLIHLYNVCKHKTLIYDVRSQANRTWLEEGHECKQKEEVLKALVLFLDLGDYVI